VAFAGWEMMAKSGSESKKIRRIFEASEKTDERITKKD
jgi:hypothetical protein